MTLPKFLQLKPAVEEKPHSHTQPHTHAWAVDRVTYAAPRRDLPAAMSATLAAETLHMALFGVTTIVSKCEQCGEFKKDSMLGSDRMQLDELLDRVLEQGAIVYHRDGMNFVIQPYVQQQAGGIPLR